MLGCVHMRYIAKLSLAATFVLSASLPALAETTTVNFNTASHQMLPQARQILEQFVEDNAGACYNLSGHTDTRGSLSYNQALSERRVRSVAGYLATLDSSVAVTTADAAGETRLVVAREGDVLLNRRVEIEAYDCAGAPGGFEPSPWWAAAGLPVLCLVGPCGSSSATTTTTTTTTTTN